MDPSLSGLEREFAALSLSGVTETGKELGRGSYGEVREANWLGTPCATKRVHPLLVSQAGAAEISKASRDFIRECRTWKDLRHPHIVQLLGVVFEQASPLPVLVMERLSTSLRRFLEDHPKAQFPLSRKAVVLHQVSLALAYLHSLKYIHRDLSTNNILLDTETWKAAKITDFGVTRVLDTTRSRMTGSLVPGTQAFMPPEVFEIPAQFSDKVDVFSFGCVAISTLTHQWPDPGPAKRREGGKVIGLTEHQRREHYFGMFTPQEKELFQRLTEGCLQEDPSSRPSCSALVEELARIREEARKSSNGETVSGRPPVLEAARLGQLSTVRKLLDSGTATVGDQDKTSLCEGMTALLWASYGCHLPVVRELVNVYKVNLFQKDKEGRNAMHLAALGGHIEVIKYLLPLFGVRVHEKDMNSYTMLHWAAWGGHCQVAGYLIQELQMDPQNRDKWGTTALLRAAYGGSVSLVRALLEDYGSLVDEVNVDGSNAMHKAAQGGSLDVIKYLLPMFGARVHEKDTNSFTMLHWAAREGHCQVAHYLIESVNIDPQDKDKWGYTALLRAASAGHAEVVRMLLDCGSTLTEVTNDGWTAVQVAAANGHLALVRELLEQHRADLLHKSNDGFNALHFAAYNGHLDVVKYLVPRFGQHRFDEDNDGKTCLDWAVEGQKHNVLEYLQQKGGFSDRQ